MKLPFLFRCLYRNLCAVCLFESAEATGANGYGLGRTVFNYLYLANIGLPTSVCLAVRVRNVMSENNAFSANAALCHIKHLLRFFPIWTDEVTYTINLTAYIIP